jgi:O-antigen ligase
MIETIDSENRRYDPLPSGIPFLVLVGVCLILVALLLSQAGFSPVVIVGIGLIFACILVPARWPYGAFIVLSLASVMPSLSMEIGGWNARPEHCATFLVLIAILFRLIFYENRRVTWNFTDFAVAAYVAWNYVSSAWMSPDRKSTLRWALLNNLVVLSYFLIRFLVTDARALRWVFKAFLAIGIAECMFALLCFASRELFATSFGTVVDQYAGGAGGVYGTHYEPNLLGSFAACLSIMLLVVYFMSQRRPKWLVGGAIVGIAAMLASLSRAAFLAFILVSVVLLFLGVRAGLVNLRRVLPLGFVVALFVAPIAATGGRNLVSRFVTLSVEGVENDSEAVGRLVAMSTALEDIARHPLVGNGTASFQLLADPKQFPILGDRPWVGNSPIRILHDTGVMGLILMGVVVLGLAKNVRKAIVGQALDREIIFALAAGCLVYAVSFMATEGTILSFFWVHIGLLGSACSFVTAK